MDKVYLVVEQPDDLLEQFEIYGVFTTKENAQKYINTVMKAQPKFTLEMMAMPLNANVTYLREGYDLYWVAKYSDGRTEIKKGLPAPFIHHRCTPNPLLIQRYDNENTYLVYAPDAERAKELVKNIK